MRSGSGAALTNLSRLLRLVRIPTFPREPDTSTTGQALLGAARCRAKDDAIVGFGDLVDHYAVKMRQEPADDLITPITQRSIMVDIDHSSRDRTPFPRTESPTGRS